MKKESIKLGLLGLLKRRVPTKMHALRGYFRCLFPERCLWYAHAKPQCINAQEFVYPGVGPGHPGE